MRLFIVSNRLPVEIHQGGVLALSMGGLASGLKGVHQKFSSWWFGWPGIPKEQIEKSQLEKLNQDLSDKNYYPIHLSAAEIQEFYEDFSNGVLWPLFHYLLDRLPLQMRGWEKYVEVNAKFADAIQKEYRPGDIIWVQDYHLLLLPGMLRERLPNAKIGFFLHIPFPSSEVFRVLPWREDILQGLCGADVIGFHTFSYSQHFSSSLLRILGIECHMDTFSHNGREITFGAFPMGIEESFYSDSQNDSQTNDYFDQIRKENGGKFLFLAVDRLDYTKGISRRLLAFERLLEEEPGFRTKCLLVQVAVPSRSAVPAYQNFRREVEELVGRINGRFGGPGYQPIHYITQSFSPLELIALYRAAHVMMVTPLRDGMNLVAKEFIASRRDKRGVLILSEFAGAASELGEALIVNPYDIQQTADAMKTAINMSDEEMETRMAALRERVAKFSASHWSEEFLSLFEASKPVVVNYRPLPISVEGLVKKLKPGPLHLVVDYDGTLVPFQPTPSLAAPDLGLMILLQALAKTPGVTFHLVSGRKREDIETWFRSLPIHLYAEHGFWGRSAKDYTWNQLLSEKAALSNWKEKIFPLFNTFTQHTPGSIIEEKSASIAWHYRMCDPALAAKQLNELKFQLLGAVANEPLEVISGSKVLEVRFHEVHKGKIILRLLNKLPPEAHLLAMGDDTTDEDMFRVLPENAFSVKIGRAPSVAKFSLVSYKEAREFLTRVKDVFHYNPTAGEQWKQAL